MDDAWTFPGETEAARAARLLHEADLIAEAEQELAEGRFITGAELKRFLDWFVSDKDEPPPGDP